MRKVLLLLALAAFLTAGCSPTESSRPGATSTAPAKHPGDGKPDKKPGNDPG
jgi:hypothetical protein